MKQTIALTAMALGLLSCASPTRQHDTQPTERPAPPTEQAPPVEQTSPEQPIEAAPAPAQAEPAQPEPAEPMPEKPTTAQAVEPEPDEAPARPEKPLHVPAKPARPEPRETPILSRRIAGSVHLSADQPDDAEVGDSVVYFVPDSGPMPRPKPQHRVIKTRNKRFDPAVLVVPVGSTVEFPNQDTILHNVFSVSPQNPFDLGLYGGGESGRATFDRPGVVYVHCNVHHAMQADVLVLESPWFARIGSDGRFVLEDVPLEAGRLFLWHPRARLHSSAITAQSMALDDLRFELDIVRPKVPKHLNKFGRSYRPVREQ